MDWWALGIVIFEMLAGYPPFYNIKAHAVYNDVIKNAPELPTHFDCQGKELIKDTAPMNGNVGLYLCLGIFALSIYPCYYGPDAKNKAD